MKTILKKILQKAGLYFFLQGNYRSFLSFIDRMSLRIRYSKYKGSGYECNFCGRSYKKFAPRYSSKEDEGALKKYDVIAGKGENIYCPYCMSTARERLIVQMLKDHFTTDHKRILHISPEKKIFNYLRTRANVTTADIVPGFYKLIDHNVEYADVTRLSFPDETFDLVIGNHIMEHIPGDKKAMHEIFRVLKNGGQAILQVPFSEVISETIEDPDINDPGKQSELFGQKDHVRIYNIQDYIGRLKNAGFTVNYISPVMLKKYSMYAIQPGEGFIDIRK